jgi:hypothetical protein
MHFQKSGNTLIRTLLAASLALLLGACNQDGGSISGTTSSSTTGSSTSTGTGSSGGSATGSFSLSWTAPVSRTDGSPLALSEIGGYRVYYGTSPGNYPNSINITNGSLQSATLSGVPLGTYYVAMSTYDTSGVESNYSAPVVKKSL